MAGPRSGSAASLTIAVCAGPVGGIARFRERRHPARSGRRERVQALDPHLDTLPKLLLHNAAALGSRPAMRHKDLGIWQTWTWAQVLDEIRAFSLGLAELGLKRGDKFTIIGSNRPRL